MNRSMLAFVVAAYSAFAQNYDILLKGGNVIDPKNGINRQMDVAIANGKIARVAADIPASEAKKAVNVAGLTVTPGLIDIHVHVYQRPELKTVERDSSVQADAHTFPSGVTTVVDAGTSGWRTFPDFKARVIDKSQTRVLALLNIVGRGMAGRPYEQLARDMDPVRTAATALEFPGV